MHRRQIKKKSKFLIFRMIIPPVFLFALLSVLYFYFPLPFNKKIISPITMIRPSEISKDSVEKSLSQEGLSYSSIEVLSDSSYLINLADGTQAIITPKKNIKDQISSLQLMLTRLTIEGKRIKTVDLRYDRPIIRL